MFSVTYMGFSVFVLLTAMVNGPNRPLHRNDPGSPGSFSLFSFLTSVSQGKQDHRLPHRTYIVYSVLVAFGHNKALFLPPGPTLTKAWSNFENAEIWSPHLCQPTKTTSDPLYNSVQPISEGSDQQGPTFKSLTRPWSFGKKSRNGASKLRKWPSIRFSWSRQ